MTVSQLLFLESPSSLSFELHDLPALAAAARARGAAVAVDNTYGPLLLRPLALGADVRYRGVCMYYYMNGCVKKLYMMKLCPSRWAPALV